MELNGHSYNNVFFGVPLGSIVGPHFFLSDANDLSKVSALVDSVLFSDDINLFVSWKDPNVVWLSAKTKFMVLKPRMKMQQLYLQVCMNQQVE